jgi:hypothetical protein
MNNGTPSAEGVGSREAISDLNGVVAKLRRAKKHLYEFEQSVAEYLVTETFGPSRQFENHIPEKSGRPGITWRARLGSPPSEALATQAGDVLHNLRSALDHMAWATVSRYRGTPEIPATRFPMVEERLTKDDKVKKVTIAGSIPDDVSDFLDSLQPYHRVDDPTLHSLAMLSHLSNVDKHRTLNLLAVDFGRVTIQFFGERQRVGWSRPEPFRDGALIFWVLEEHPDFDRNEEAEVRYSPQLAFRDAGRIGKGTRPAEELLKELYDFVTGEVIEPVADRFFNLNLDLPRAIL